MPTRHLVINIESVLEQDDNFLDELFERDGVRKELEELKSKGDKYIGSDGCNHFDPTQGCRCHLFESETKTKTK